MGATLPSMHLNWQNFTDADTGLFLWEAFVTGEAKATMMSADGGEHAADALIACKEFAALLPNPAAESDCEPSAVRSLIGAAALWSDWTEDLMLLRSRCLVVKPKGPTT